MKRSAQFGTRSKSQSTFFFFFLTQSATYCWGSHRCSLCRRYISACWFTSGADNGTQNVSKTTRYVPPEYKIETPHPSPSVQYVRYAIRITYLEGGMQYFISVMNYWCGEVLVHKCKIVIFMLPSIKTLFLLNDVIRITPSVRPDSSS